MSTSIRSVNFQMHVFRMFITAVCVTFLQPSQKSTNFTIKKQQKNLINKADSERCGAVNAMVIKNVKDANVLLKLLPICKEFVNVVSRFKCKKNSLSFALQIWCLLSPQK